MSNISRILLPRSLKILLVVVIFTVLLAVLWVITLYLPADENRRAAGLLSWLLAGLFLLLCVAALLSAGILFYRWIARRNRPPMTATDPLADSPLIVDSGQILRHALRQIKQSGTRPGVWHRFFKETATPPWYLLLGASQSGKTATLCQAGQFLSPPEKPFTGLIAEQEATHCHCWLANDVVYLETHGKFISEPLIATGQWLEMVKSLKKYRPSASVQGVILTLSVTDLLAQDTPGLSEMAGIFRMRLTTLQQIPGISFPVYVVLTHLDLLEGFSEFFHDLTEEERRQLWGITLPADTAPSAVGEYVHQQFQQLLRRIDAGLNRRLQNEYDVQVRRKMYGFPENLQQLCQPLDTFIRSLFFVSRYQEAQALPMFRGLYLTSSCQKGDATEGFSHTLIRQWESQCASSSAKVHPQSDSVSEEVAGGGGDALPGRPFFLRQLFCELMINDQTLAKDTRLNLIRLWKLRWPVHLVLLLLISVVMYGLAGSFIRYSRDLQDVKQQLAVVHQLQDDLLRENDLAATARLLAGLRRMVSFSGGDPLARGTAMGFRLFSDGGVAAASGGVYQSALRQLLLPVAGHHAGVALQQAVTQADLPQVYRQLRVYLMVYGMLPADAPYLASVLTPVLNAAENLSDNRNATDFNSDLLALFSHPELRNAGEGVDAQLLQQARNLLGQQPRAARLYQQLLQRLSAYAPPAFTLSGITESGQGQWFTLRGGATQQSIDGLFTYRGYQQVKKHGIRLLVSLEKEDRQLMDAGPADENTAKASLSESAEVYHAVLSHYLDDYTRYWQEMLSNIRISLPAVSGPAAAVAEQQRNLYRLSRLAASGSPLVRLMEQLVAETTLMPMQSVAGVSEIITRNLTSPAQAVWQQGTDAEQQLIRKRVDSHFAELRQFVTGQDSGFNPNEPSAQGNALSLLLGQLNELQLLFRLHQDPLTARGSAAWPAMVVSLRAESQRWPDPLKNIILPLLDNISAGIGSADIGRSNAAISEGPGAFCRNNLAGHYPFSDSRQDVSLADFSRFFAPGGIADSYFRQHLADKVDTLTVPWQFINMPAGDPRHQKLQLFRRAREIRSLFFQGEESTRPSLPVSLVVTYLSPTITRLEFTAGQSGLVYSHGPVRPLSLNWPGGSSGVPVNLTLTADNPGDIQASQWSGPWALFRWIESARQLRVQPSGELTAEFSPDGHKAIFTLSGLVSDRQPVMSLLKRFRCR